jgi:hypothetical protein
VRSRTLFHVRCFHSRNHYTGTVKRYCPTYRYGKNRQLAVEETKVACAQNSCTTSFHTSLKCWFRIVSGLLEISRHSNCRSSYRKYSALLTTVTHYCTCCTNYSHYCTVKSKYCRDCRRLQLPTVGTYCPAVETAKN